MKNLRTRGTPMLSRFTLGILRTRKYCWRFRRGKRVIKLKWKQNRIRRRILLVLRRLFMRIRMKMMWQCKTEILKLKRWKLWNKLMKRNLKSKWNSSIFKLTIPKVEQLNIYNQIFKNIFKIKNLKMILNFWMSQMKMK